MSDVTVVGLIPSYKEGRLLRGAVASLLESHLDAVYVYEGPAGEPLEDDVPDSDLPIEGCIIRQGRWRTDARKRTTMATDVKARHPSPLWAVWLDADEILVNGWYIRDLLQALQWHDEAHPQEPPHIAKPLRHIEIDGGIVWARARLMRIDLVQSYNVSSALFTNAAGVEQGAGNFPDTVTEWYKPRAEALEDGQLFQPPPLSCEPHVVHRAWFRHPARAGHRMHAQEKAELAKRDA